METFDSLYVKYATPSYRVAFLILGDQAEAEDVVQEAFIAAFRARERFGTMSSFATWLYRIVVNQSYDALRRRQRDARRLEKAASHAINSNRRGVETELEQAEQHLYVREKISSLSEIYRSVVVLRHFGDCSFKEISQILKCPEGTVKRRLHTAYKLLRQELEKEGER
jgi:RNA polymerase sigma-70 factor (ECF subfamily)